MQERSHGTKSAMLGRKLDSATSKTKESHGGLERVALVCESHCVTCVAAWLIFCHLTRLCKGTVMSSYFGTNSYKNLGKIQRGYTVIIVIVMTLFYAAIFSLEKETKLQIDAKSLRWG